MQSGANKIILAHIMQRRGISNVTISLNAELQYSRFTDLEEEENNNHNDWTV